MTIWIPPWDGDVQYSKIADFLACGSFSAIHIAEMKDRNWTGTFREYSERALAKLSGTNKQGNTLQHIVDAINNYGLIKTEDWPELTDGTNDVSWDEFYAEIPPEVLTKADKGWKCHLVSLNPSEVENRLSTTPIWTIIPTSGGTDHIVALITWGDGQYGLGTYYDSYQLFIKDIQPNFKPLSYWDIQLTYTPMSNVEFVHKAGTQEYGFYFPALSQDAIKDKALNVGQNILNPDGTINFNQAKEVQGL